MCITKQNMYRNVTPDRVHITMRITNGENRKNLFQHPFPPDHSDQEVLDGHVRQQLIGDAGELHRQLLLQLWLHGLEHLQAVLAQEQVGGFG